ncbi:Pecanex-like protein 1 [Actinoplanes sp. NEAU-A12]|uniref:Pecanex-like protein 1 n=1 Tax=Actinoplanes sandaracinus TaxID=3045177 RepID=A0ABT6WTZ1_9ACTN|nr:Pecanex-like protein 1 [Actinoplanes sandaracinus]MDI6103216.1 Pecanex-like protein 1 [Actinoplanes sandaracinus]
MRRSKYRRADSTAWFSGRRRIIAVAAASLAAFGGVVTVTQISNAGTEKNTVRNRALAACDNLQAPANSKLSTQTRKGTYTTDNGQVTQHADDGAGNVATTDQVRSRCRDWVLKNVSENAVQATTQARRGNNNGGNQANTGKPQASVAATQQGGQQQGGQQQGGQQQGGQQQGGQQQGGQQQGGQQQGGQQQGGQQQGGQQQGGQQQGGQQQGGQQQGGQQQGGQQQGGQQQGGQQGGQQQGGQQQGGQQQGGQQGGGAVTPPPGAGLGVIANSCDNSNLPPHDGFQKGNRCVSTEFGEVAAAANNATLLITNAPKQVNRNQPFTLQVSTRNLIRDRFLAAGQGGYYVESSVLQGGLVRGHFHTACRILDNRNAAPAPDPVPAFFVATEDNKGGAAPDTVAIQVPGLPQSGEFQCSSWAGDGSHRTPMMERANQTPAFDSVRIRVR